MKRRGLRTALRGKLASFRCPHCGGVHRVTWDGPHHYRLPCAFGEDGEYRRNAVLYEVLAEPPKQLELPLCG